MRFDIITLFPNLCSGYLSDSILKRAINEKKIIVKFWQLRDFSDDQKHFKVDDTPYGGGAGMVIRPQPLYNAITTVKKENNGKVIYLSPQGPTLNQQKVKELSEANQDLILLAGRYEGIDERIKTLLIDEEISIGDYVLTGGELPALVLIDAVSRLLPGVLGKDESSHQDSFSESYGGKKEHPHYTRPAEFMGLKVPDVLISGDHAKIAKWRHENLQ